MPASARSPIRPANCLSAVLDIKPVGVPFNGTGPAMNALVGGQVDYMCDQIVNAVPQINGGTIKAYAIATAERNPSLPDLPTTAEAGLPKYQASAWNAIFAPKGTPAPILAKLNAAAAKALDDENVRKRLLDLGSDIPKAEARTPGRAGGAGEERDRKMVGGAQARDQLIGTGDTVERQGRDLRFRPCRLRHRSAIFPGIISCSSPNRRCRSGGLDAKFAGPGACNHRHEPVSRPA